MVNMVLTRVKRLSYALMILNLSFILVFFIFSKLASGATIYGGVYNPDLSITKKAVVFINSTPKQNMVAINGSYSFAIPAGTYQIQACAPVKDAILCATEILTVPQDGDFIMDLILFDTSSIDESFLDSSDLDKLEVLFKENFNEDKSSHLSAFLLSLFIIIIILLVFVLSLLIFKFLKNKKRKKIKKRTKKFRAKAIKEQIETLKPIGDEALARVLEILKRERRVTQKDIRKEMGISEAKMSLLIADLEAQGKIRKIKRGRSNIIIYQE